VSPFFLGAVNPFRADQQPSWGYRVPLTTTHPLSAPRCVAQWTSWMPATNGRWRFVFTTKPIYSARSLPIASVGFIVRTVFRP